MIATELTTIWTSEWFFFTDLVEHLVKVASLENKSLTSGSSNISQENKVLPTKRKSNIITSSSKPITSHKNDQRTTCQVIKPHESTLWEREEYTVRYILEESKANLLLRMIVDFKKYQYDVMKGIAFIPQISLYDETTLCSKMRVFEESTTLLLKYCLMAVEVVQTFDIALLAQHASDVLDFVLSNDYVFPDDPALLMSQQELRVVQCMNMVLISAERLNEESIASKFLEKHLPLKVTHFLSKGMNKVSESVYFELSWFISLMLDLEYVRTNKDLVFSTDEDKKHLVSLFNPIIKPLLTDYEKKKALRSLVDIINRFGMNN